MKSNITSVYDPSLTLQSSPEISHFMLFKYHGPLLPGYRVNYILLVVGLFVQYLSTLLDGKLHEDREHVYICSISHNSWYTK